MLAVAFLAVAAHAPPAPPSLPRVPTSHVQQQVYTALERAENCMKWLNPGCLKYARQPGAVRGPHGYAMFRELRDGQAALWCRVQVGRGQTVWEFLSGYNPGVENYPFRVAALVGLDLEAIL